MMYKFLSRAKLELFYWRKTIFQYHKFWRYLYNKYILAPKILKLNKILEKPINQPDLSIHILTCHRDLIMAIWSLASFYQHSAVIGQLYIHDDGSLTQKDKGYLKKFFPSAKIIEEQQTANNYFKLDNYSLIKQTRINNIKQYFLLKKLIDPFLVSPAENILVIDSDLLWFKRPTELEEVIKKKERNSLMMSNNIKAFVYFKGYKKIKDELATYNSGIVFYKKDNYNLDKLTEYFKAIDYSNLENKHFIEQAAYAHCLENLEKLSTEKYVINKNLSPKVAVKHYTSPRRPLFYIEGIGKLKDKII